MKKSINRIAFFNFLSILLLQGISFISSPLFSRLLGTQGYGNLAAFSTWAGITATVLSLQTNVTIANARVEFSEGEQPAYQSSAMTLSLLSFAIGSVLIMLLAEPISAALKMNRWLLALLLVQAFGTFGVNFLSSKFTYEFKADKNMLLSVFIAVVSMGVALVFVLNAPMEQRYLGRIMGNALVYGAVGTLGCLWILAKGRKAVNRRYWKFCFFLGCPLVFQNLAYSILGSSDILMLKQMAGASDSGIYSLAFTLAGIMFTIFNALNNSWVPFFFDDMKQGSRENVVRQSKNFLELFTVLSLGFVLLVREVYHIYADREFWPGLELIPVFTASYYVNALCTFPVNFELYHKKTGVVAAATVAAALVNLVLNYTFIRLFGMTGAAVATLLSHCLQLAMHECYSRLVLGKKDYPFALSTWVKYSAVMTAAMVLFYAAPDQWYIRWPLAAAMGVWELYRIWKRRSLL
ncbi:MAG: lipopolysaccharide biosynthesis protein [Faecousia sp.]